MQTIARLVGYNECCFVCSSRVAELRLRYFTPGHETGSCYNRSNCGMDSEQRDRTGCNISGRNGSGKYRGLLQTCNKGNNDAAGQCEVLTF